jgi:acetyl esterase/lipase
MTKRTLFAFIALLCSACSPVRWMNAMIPSSGYRLQPDIVYQQSHGNALDVYVPAHGQSRAVVVFFYGGSWESGRRQDYRFVAEALTARGYSVVIPDYRKYPEVVFPAFVEDAAAAVAWVHRHIAEYGGDPGRIFVAGHSAGAHIAALLALDPTYLQAQAMSPMDLRGMIGLAGPYDFLPLQTARLKAVFPGEHLQYLAQPVNVLQPPNPPVLLLVGRKDETVLPRNSESLAQHIQKTGGRVELRYFENEGHIGMALRLARPFQGDGRVVQAIGEFIDRETAF